MMFQKEETRSIQKILWSIWIPSIYTMICRV